MGLDVYLYKYQNYEDTIKREKEYSDRSNKIWELAGEYEKLSESQKEQIRQECEVVQKELGLEKYGECKNKEAIQIDSSLYPEHYFKVGYFRSSYNETGIERVLGNMGIGGLYEIFNPENKYKFQPDWNHALIKCNESILVLSNAIKEDKTYRCFEVSLNELSGHPDNNPIDSQAKALQVFFDEMSKSQTFDAYSNSKGHFYHKEPIKVSAIIEGVRRRLLGNGKLPCTYIIYKDESIDWYLQALEIVKETIEYVLRQEDKDKYYLHWSS